MSSDEYDVRLVLEEKQERGKETKYRVAWENSWVKERDLVGPIDFLSNLKILGITEDSDQKKIKQAKFVIENLGAKENVNRQQIWTYEKLRAKAPELLLSFYEEQLKK